MDDRLLTLLALIAVPIYILLFWNFVRSVIIMGRRSIWWGITGFIFSPISQIIFHLFNGSLLSVKDSKVFKAYYWLMGLIFICGIALSVVIPNVISTNSLPEDNYIAQSTYVADMQLSPIVAVESHESSKSPTTNLNESYQNSIESMHPDARAVVASRDFSSWLQVLPSDLNSNFNRILAEGDTKEVIYMLDEFKKYRKEQDYKNDIEYKEIEMIKQTVTTSTHYSAVNEQTAEQQIAANKKTMRVFIEAEAANKKKSLIRGGYTEQQAQAYMAEWVAQKTNGL